MIYNRFRFNVVDEQKAPSYRAQGQTADSRHSLAGVAMATSTWWDLAHVDQLRMVVCHAGLQSHAQLGS